ncbi:hypothetical protein BJX61DRAFT_27811 [Aspergillus egyptiacus]|nr:hypothetical protein BJX61DRAFT_27811 [Aspergillus egyptiacus]
MYRVVVPKKSSVHRFACLALYRALLRQCKEVRKAAPQLIAAQSHIRDRFRRYRTLQSPSQSANSLKAGYEALDLLHSAARGNEEDTNVIKSILSEAQSVKRQKQNLQAVVSKKHSLNQPTSKQLKRLENKRFQEMTSRRHPDATPILSRPRPVVSGRRHVPVLVNASGLPMLRIKKPQPKILSAIILAKSNQRFKWFERLERLKQEIIFGQDEDEWDSLTTGKESVTWTSVFELSMKEYSQKISGFGEKNRETAEAMWRVVLAERRLAEAEKQRSAET